MEILKANGNKLILCCSAGFDNVPIDLCKAAGIKVARVPSYSPSSIAEYAISSMLALAKNLQKSYEQTKDADFTIGGLQCILVEDKTVRRLVFLRCCFGWGLGDVVRCASDCFF